MPTPKWTQDIRSGNFEAAEDDLTNKAAAKIIPVIEQQYWATQVNAAVDRIDQEAGPYTKYCKLEVTQKIQEDMQRGTIKTPQEMVDRYSHHMNQSISEFKSNVRPGHGREVIPLINGNTLTTYQPSDESVLDYVAGRNKVVQDQKQDAPMTGVYQRQVK